MQLILNGTVSELMLELSFELLPHMWLQLNGISPHHTSAVRRWLYAHFLDRCIFEKVRSNFSIDDHVDNSKFFFWILYICLCNTHILWVDHTFFDSLKKPAFILLVSNYNVYIQIFLEDYSYACASKVFIFNKFC